MSERPRGTVTFLFTDIEGSTRLLSAVGADRYGELLGRHQDLIRAAVAAHHGHEVDTQGDAFFVAFERPRDAAGAAVDAQRALAGHPWPPGAEVRVRMAVHTGEATTTSHGYVGVGVHRTARICAAGHGGQVLVSQASHDLLLDDGTIYGFLDLGEHRLKDLPDPQRLFQLTAPGLATGFPPLRSMTTPTNLPADVTSFVGREREVADVRGLLDGHRLVSLVGVGGTGKTRLMLRVAGEVTGRFAEGAWLVELAPLREPELVADVVVHSLAIQVGAGQTAIAALTDFLRDKDLLLLLDNCEHVIEAAAALVERLLPASPALRIVATSREALGVAGEATYPVPSLAVPGELDHLDLSVVAGSEAVRLFVERAETTLPGFQLDETTAGPVVEICRRLDGIPLALELAAARINVLSAAEIAAGLGDRFRLLTGGRRTAVPRQQTLQALIDWSWDLLDEPDRRLLRRLSVFAGGTTLEAAAAVAGSQGDAATNPDGAARLDTLDGLSRLVDRSLVVVEHAGTTRYRMLETIRQYAGDRLVASDEATELRARHLAWFHRFAIDAAAGIQGPDMVAWLARLDADMDNLRVALDWAFEADVQAGLEMCAAVGLYWRSRAVGSEGMTRMLQAVELARRWRTMPSSTPDATRAGLGARVMAAAIWLAGSAGWASVVSLGEEAVAYARASGDAAVLVDALAACQQVEMMTKGVERIDDLRAISDEALGLATALDDPARLVTAAVGRALVEAPVDPAAAERWLETATESARRTSNPWSIAGLFQMRGRVASRLGRAEEAIRWFREARQKFEAIGDMRFALSSQSEIAHVLRRSGAVDEAEAEYRKTIRGWQRTGNRGAVANQLESLAFTALAKGDGERAARLFGAAEALRESSGDPMTATERAEYEAEVARLNALLDPRALADGWADGRRLTADEAVSFAAAV